MGPEAVAFCNINFLFFTIRNDIHAMTSAIESFLLTFQFEIYILNNDPEIKH